MKKTQNNTNSFSNNNAVALSKIELNILYHIKNGLTSTEISKIRNCSSRTIEKHRSNIIQKLGLKPSQNALLLWMQKN